MSEKATLPIAHPVADDVASTQRILKAEDFPEEPITAPKRSALRLVAFASLALIMLVSLGKHAMPAGSTIGRGLMRGCGKGRMLSSTAGLPTHYMLPTGDKIPSVALGTAASSVRPLLLLTPNPSS